MLMSSTKMSSPNKHDRPLCIGLSLATTWLSASSWPRPHSGIEGIYESQLYVDLAQRAEAAKLDFLFRPDTLFLITEVVAHSPGFSGLDPSILLATLARETKHIGLVSTASTTFYPPYVVARQLQSLNWVSQGRAGWNVVTALGGNTNFGQSQMLSTQERYAKAQEFVEVVQKLWQSYPHQALLLDRAQGRYADPNAIQAIQHDQQFFQVEGPLNLPAYEHGRIPLFQAGASEIGRNFAALISDGIFAATPDMDAATELRSDLRQRAVAYGRSPNDIRVLPGLYLFLGQTKQEAQALYQETQAVQDNKRKFAYLKETLGIDLSQFPLDQPVTASLLPQDPPKLLNQTRANLLKRLILREQPTLQDLLKRPEVVGSAHWLIVGTAEDALTEINQWTKAGAIDGFIALPGGSTDSLGLFFDELMPLLSEQGLFRKEYQGITLSEHMGLTS